MDEIISILIIFLIIAAWLTHVITCFVHGLWAFLLAGAIFFPIGIVHGIFVWLQ